MGAGRDALNQWLAQNPGSDPSWAPQEIRHGAWAEEPTDYLAKAAAKTAGFATTYGGAGYGRQPDDWLGAAMGGWAPPASWQRRMSLLGFTPAPGKDRMSRSLAAAFQNVPAVRELAISAEDFPVTDYQTAARRYLTTLGEEGADPIAWAVKQGFMPKLPARTIPELVGPGPAGERMMKILGSQGLLSPELQRQLEQQLEAVYQAEMEGTEAPEFKPAPGGGSFLPPVPSMQFYNQLLGAGEREGVRDLFGAMEISPEELADMMAKVAPPGGGSNLARRVYRRL